MATKDQVPLVEEPEKDEWSPKKTLESKGENKLIHEGKFEESRTKGNNERRKMLDNFRSSPTSKEHLCHFQKKDLSTWSDYQTREPLKCPSPSLEKGFVFVDHSWHLGYAEKYPPRRESN